MLSDSQAGREDGRRNDDSHPTALHYPPTTILYTTPLRQSTTKLSVVRPSRQFIAPSRPICASCTKPSPSPSRRREGRTCWRVPPRSAARPPAIPLFCGLAPAVARCLGGSVGRSRSVVHIGLEKRFSLFSLPSPSGGRVLPLPHLVILSPLPPYRSLLPSPISQPHSI